MRSSLLLKFFPSKEVEDKSEKLESKRAISIVVLLKDKDDGKVLAERELSLAQCDCDCVC